ncbi:MAG: hypothetical protein ACLGH0_06025, partial [Thermoanaerobaculia bacterium]
MAIPPPPTSLAPNQTQWLATNGPKVNVRLSWAPSPGATSYAVRVDDLTTPYLRAPGNNCGGDPHYVCRNGVTNTFLAIPTRAGHAYRWWVHAANAEGMSAPSIATFRVGEPPLNPNFNHGAVQAYVTSPAYREILAPSPAQWTAEVWFTRTPEQQQQAFTIRGEVRDKNNLLIASGATTLPAGTALRRTLTFAVPPLAPGRYAFRIGVYSSSNVLVEQEEQEYDVHINPPLVRIAEKAQLRRNSIPWFPLGFYMANPMADEDFARMSAWGVNCAVSYGFGFLGYFTGNEGPALALARDFLDRAHRNGMGILYNFAGFYQESVPNPDQRNGLELAVEYMRNFKTHPAVLAWYTADEPELGGRVDRTPKLLAMQQLIADYDSEHPTWLVMYTGSRGVIDFHYRAADLLAVDPYAIPFLPLEIAQDWTQTNALSARGVRPNWSVTQLHDSANYARTYEELQKGTFEPTAQEKLAMTMLALIGGATGVILYSYFDLFTEV